MNLVCLSAVSFDPTGFLEILATEDTDEGEARRRVSRSPTLDGGAALSDFGFSDADRTILVKWQPSLAIDQAVLRLIESYGQLNVSIRFGVYRAAPEVYRPGTDQSTLRLLVVSKLSI